MRVALIIGNSNVKVLAIQGRQVKKWGTLALEAGLVRDGLVLQPAAVAAAIGDLFKSSRVSRERVSVSLTGLSFTYRFLGLPRLRPAMQGEAIMRAAKKEMSLSLEELYLSWQPVPGQGDGRSYFVLGVPRNPIDTAVATLKTAGIKPHAIEPQPLALARAAGRRDAIVVSLEPDSFDIVFIADGIPRVIHTIGPRGEEATLQDNIRRLADELIKTATFYQGGHPESRLTPATPLLLTGDLALKAPARGLLQAEVEYPVEPLIPPVKFPPETPVASYAACAGLALSDVPRKAPSRTQTGFYDININLLSAKDRISQARSRPASQIWLGIFLAAAVILLFPLYLALHKLDMGNANLEDELRRVNRDLGLAELAAEETSRAEKAIQTTVDNAASLKEAGQLALGDRGLFSRDLKLLTTALPAATDITSLEIDRDQIIVCGETDSIFTAVAYATALEAAPFREVRISGLDETPPPVTGTGEPESPSVGGRLITFEITINR